MKQDQKPDKVAQPADEELKKHGDQLAKQVKDAAGDNHDQRPSPGTQTQIVDD